MAADVQALVNWYAREGFWRHIQTVCTEVQKKRAGDPALAFWRSFGLILESSFSEALRELEPLQGQREVDVASLFASIHAHRLCKIVDEEAVAWLSQRLEVQLGLATERSLLQAALFHWHLGGANNLRKGRELVDRVLGIQPQLVPAQCLKGWLDLTVGKAALQSNPAGKPSGAATGALAGALATFEDVLSHSGKELEALLGRAQCLEVRGELDKALDDLNQVVVSYPWFLPGLNEKARVLLGMGDWEQALEVAQRILTLDPRNIDALRWSALYMLSHESRPQHAAKRVADVLDSIDHNEPKNAPLYYATARPLARLAGQSNPAALQRTLTLIDRARKLAPNNASYVAEYAYQQLLMGEIGQALETYRSAAHMDETNMDAVFGSIRCQLAAGQLEEASTQLEFLLEISASLDRSAQLLFLSGFLAFIKDRSLERSGVLLDQALEAHSKLMMNYRLGLDFFVELNPDMLLDAARLLLDSCPPDPKEPAELPYPLLARATKVLELLEWAVPGILEVQLLLTRANYLNNQIGKALRSVQTALRLDSASVVAHMLLGQIYLAQGKLKMAAHEVEQALAHDFSIREFPEYQIVHSRVLMSLGDLEQALKVLEGAMTLPGVRRPGTGSRTQLPSSGRVKVGIVNDASRLTIFLLLAECHRRLAHLPEATKAIQDALNEFTGTAEEARVTIANAELALTRKDVEGALGMLRSVPKESPHFMRAMVAMADVYLKQRHDRLSYEGCYRELAERSNSVAAYIMLGEAMLNIQEPWKAITAFEAALKKNPRDPDLASRIGKALVSTHDYAKAIDYYEAAVRTNRDGSESSAARAMQHDLAEMYLRLRQYAKAERVLTELLAMAKEAGAGGGASDVTSIGQNVKALLLLAKVLKGEGRGLEAIDVMIKTRALQNILLSKMQLEQPEWIRMQKLVASDICFQLGQEQENVKEFDKAPSLYSEALRHTEGHVPSMLALVRMYLRKGEVEACQQQCVSLLRTDPLNEEASLLLAQLMCQREQFDSAIYHFQQLLERKPNNYGALAQLIELLRRSGRLSDAVPFLRGAEKASSRGVLDPGLNYCKGMHFRYSNDPHQALKSLNQARRDGEWGVRALYAMVEVYLNPDNAAIWDSSLTDPDDKGSRPGDNAEAIRAAQKLLAEVPCPADKPRPIRHLVLECHAAMASKHKADVEPALARLHEAVREDTESVPALLAMATGFMLLKQTPKARNQLKRVQKMMYRPEEGDDFERCWLMLADVYLQSGKHDLAQELCRKCLKYNKSCSSAWEYLGQIMEKEQAYKDAAEHYENAWRFDNEASPIVGYRLAFNYLKAKRLVEAIDVCHKVTKAFPNYPKIRKDVLEKARAQLRP